MSTTHVSRQLIFIDSTHADNDDESPHHSNFKINFSGNQIHCAEDEKIFLQLYDFCTVNSRQSIEKGVNDRFYVVVHEQATPVATNWILIPPGKYNSTQLATQLQTLLNNTFGTWTVTFSNTTHKFHFTLTNWTSTNNSHPVFFNFFLNDTLLTYRPVNPPSDGIVAAPFIDTILGASDKLASGSGTTEDVPYHPDTHSILTFTKHKSLVAGSTFGLKNSSGVVTQQAEWTSDIPVNIGGSLTCISIETDIMSQNLETTHSKDDGLAQSHKLARIPVTVPMGGTIYHHANGSDQLEVQVPGRYLNSIRFRIVNSYGAEIFLKHKCELCLVVNIRKKYEYKTNDPTHLFQEMVKSLGEMVQLSKMNFLKN